MTYKIKDRGNLYPNMDKNPDKMGFYQAQQWEDECDNVVDPSLLNTVNVTVKEIKRKYTEIETPQEKEIKQLSDWLYELVQYDELTDIPEDIHKWFEKEKERREKELQQKIYNAKHKLTQEEFEVLRKHILSEG